MTILQTESATVICQRALGLAEHRQTFSSLEDGTTLANECRLRYDTRRRSVLSAMDWGFARYRAAGQAVVTPAPVEFPRAWVIPPEFLRLRSVLDASGNVIRHRRERVIFTADTDPVQIVYTSDFHDATQFPPEFTQALEFLLAAEFAMIYARSVNRFDVMMQNFRATIQEAESIEGLERSDDQAFADGGWIDAMIYPLARL